MTDREKEELIAALEKATGANHELDSRIAVAVGIRYRTRRTAGGHSKGREWFEDSHGGVETWARHPPAYTASIDAAMTLVDPDWRVYAIQEEYITPRGKWFAGLDHRTEHYKRGSQIGKGPTPAIALCIAALRARSLPR